MNTKMLQKPAYVVVLLLLLNACSLYPGLLAEQFPGAELVFDTDWNSHTALVEVSWSIHEYMLLQGNILEGLDPHPIYLGNVQNGTMTTLTVDSRPVSGHNPVLSPSGEFVVFFDEHIQKLHILRLGSPTQTERVLPSGRVATWSPDGQQLAILDYISDTVTVCLTDLQGQETEEVFRLSDDRLQYVPGYLSISWSPDGERLAFSIGWDSSVESYMQSDIYILSLDSRDVLRLTETSSLRETDPSWSPNSEVLVFAVLPLGLVLEPDGNLGFANADGTCTQTLTRPNIIGTSWSPDGGQIAIAHVGGVYTLNVDELGVKLTGSRLACP